MSSLPDPHALPLMPGAHLITQEFPRPRCSDPYHDALVALQAASFAPQAGMRVAITVGSRGIANLALVVKAACDWCRGHQATPIIIPAMGSHGGATGPGQQAVIEGYGVSAAAMGADILSSMEVVSLPQGDAEVPVYLDANAAACDGILVLNRVKIHTDFHGPVESGLMKMLAIGLGKQVQANAIHRHGVHGMRNIMPQVAGQVLAHGKILGGLAILENAYDETAELHAIAPAAIPEQEGRLLEQARMMMPSLPLDDIDILIVDEIGKNISGVCMDTNIIGRLYVDGEDEPQSPRINKIFARALTSESHGNALGVGLADVVTRRLADAVDWNATYENIYTSTFVRRGFMPIVMENDAQALAFAQRAIRAVDTAQQKIVRIRNTLHIDQMIVSDAALAALHDHPRVVQRRPLPAWFNQQFELNPFPSAH